MKEAGVKESRLRSRGERGGVDRGRIGESIAIVYNYILYIYTTTI